MKRNELLIDTHSHDAESQMHLARECSQPQTTLCALFTGYFRKARIIGVENRSVGARAEE